MQLPDTCIRYSYLTLGWNYGNGNGTESPHEGHHHSKHEAPPRLSGSGGAKPVRHSYGEARANPPRCMWRRNPRRSQPTRMAQEFSYCRPAPQTIWSPKLQLNYWTCKRNERFNDAFTDYWTLPSHGIRRTNERCPIAHHCPVGHRLRLSMRRPNRSWSLGSLGLWR